ncbi:MAG: hypothetical protein ACYDAO_07105 [Thermoplasmataceae archaeon]
MGEKSEEYYMLQYKRSFTAMILLWLVIFAIIDSESYFVNLSIENILGILTLILLIFFLLPILAVQGFYMKKLNKLGISISISYWIYNKPKKYLKFYFKLSSITLVLLIILNILLYEVITTSSPSSILSIYSSNAAFASFPFVLFDIIGICFLSYYLKTYEQHQITKSLIT